jgi:hypothetical protein
MDTEMPDSADLSPSSSTETSGEQATHSKGHGLEDTAPALEPADLVAAMVTAGEWPDPGLLEQLVLAGDAAVEPLIALLRSPPRGYAGEESLYHAIVVLGTLRPPAAIPELVEVVKRYKSDIADIAADALAEFDAQGFETLLELCKDPSLQGYKRAHIRTAAARAVDDDPVRRSQLAQVCRLQLEELISKAREEVRLYELEANDGPEDELVDADEYDEELDDWDEELDELDEWDDDAIDDEPIDEEQEPGVEPRDEHLLSVAEQSPNDDSQEDDPEVDDPDIDAGPAEELAFVVGDLVDLGDQASFDLIRTAFKEGLVDDSIVDESIFDDCDDRVGDDRPEPKRRPDWLGIYRIRHTAHFELLRRPPRPLPIDLPLPDHRYEDCDDDPAPSPVVSVTAPIRNTGPALGRNDPCWCGSGKKFKKCHLGKDTLVDPK